MLPRLVDNLLYTLAQPENVHMSYSVHVHNTILLHHCCPLLSLLDEQGITRCMWVHTQHHTSSSFATLTCAHWHHLDDVDLCSIVPQHGFIYVHAQYTWDSSQQVLCSGHLLRQHLSITLQESTVWLQDQRRIAYPVVCFQARDSLMHAGECKEGASWKDWEDAWGGSPGSPRRDFPLCESLPTLDALGEVLRHSMHG